MFLPAHNKRFIDKALECSADGIILDIEDAVPPYKREEARRNIVEYDRQGILKKRKNIFIRINPINSMDFIADISELVVESIDGFMPSKVDTSEDIIFIDKLLTFFERKNGLAERKFKLTPLIETTKAIENISEIAGASDRLAALCLGGEDYLNDLGTVYMYQESALAYPRTKVVNAARANGLLPIDTPYLNIDDIDGFADKQVMAYKNGFAGCLILNPKQIEPANRAFSPDQKKIEMSQKVISAVKEAELSGKASVAMMDGVMVGPPMLKRAENVMSQIK